MSLLALLPLLLGVAVPAPSAAASPAGGSSIRFTEVTAAAGIHFVHDNGRSGRKLLPETLGSGVAFVDLDGDGRPDLLFVNGHDWTPGGKQTTAALYRNDGDGTFTDVTAGSGLDVELYGFGVAVADYDDDGRADVYLTALEGDRLFHNEGGFRFRDVTRESGIADADFGTSAAWLDFDRDGLADLFVATYVAWSAATDQWCSLDGTTKSYCTPQSYKPRSSKLFHNLGGGRFADVSRSSGVAQPPGKALGVAVVDYDGDGWPDLFVANDTEANKLYHNERDGTFSEHALEAGVALGDDGQARGGMGADAADFTGSGRPGLAVGNFSREMIALYENQGGGVFVDRAPLSALGPDSRLTLAFAVLFFDYDLDGRPDLFAANGHLEEGIERVQPEVRYREAPQLFRNLGGGRFEEVAARLGGDLARPVVARGAAVADYDGDGDLDLVLTTNGGAAHLFRNDGGNRRHWLALRLEGSRSNRSALGAVVRLASASGRQVQTVHSGSSYCSQSDLALTFGLGDDATVEALDVDWPSGAHDHLSGLAADQLLTLEEGKGIVARAPAAVVLRAPK